MTKQFAAIGPISVHLPEKVESNAVLKEDNPRWDMDLIASKTGIHNRHIAAEDETSSDLGVAACEKLFAEHDIDPASIDFLLFCTQTPDFALPTTACLMQNRLGLRTDCGALDFNLGCSAYPYGLSIADGLIQSGVAKRILFVTAETYSKFIDKNDRSIRTIFGDAAAATLIEPHSEPSITGYKFGTDGSGAHMLCVTPASPGGFRKTDQDFQPQRKRRWKSDLYMDGPNLINFTLSEIPKLIEQILASSDSTKDELDQYLVHQATFKMLDMLRQQLGIDESQIPIELADVGNTVSSTLPILITQLREQKRLSKDRKNILIGFGVGLSWSGCVWKDVLQPG
ncbi:ketoacyl-ACP synthase III [Mariniblastus fucicola]|uniref:3-oxoacyl-[acyl-carrier-protein] synthase 3 n=1 Tax=Mariniblastus fucicola TaxID=980251 RepID=A0A5B9PER0_9BACT|nr:ketoacyl-ACP synthase III [Mariniblastus fucicola]QEG21393.1 3-oxoacyl-[acyl-carrier-protein] synthase 3 [Mariniblastus fucicola]